MALGAASPKPSGLSVQNDDVAPLSLPASVIAQPAKVAVKSAMFEAAPVPDPDASGPNSVIDPREGLGPRLLSAKNEFEGDGYSYGSSQHATLDARKQPAAGLGLNVPVKY